MPDIITVHGVVATEPKHVETAEGLKITSFRLASQQRRYDRAQSKWIDAETNWFTITAFRQLAENAQASIGKGDRVLVQGRLRMRDWTSGERTGVTVEVEAESMGHDLAWGRTEYRKVLRAPVAAEGSAPAAEPADEAPVPDPSLAELETAGAGALPF